MSKSNQPSDTARHSRYLTAAELMVELKLSENVVYRELAHGSLQSVAYRVGKQWRVRADALDRLMGGNEK